jgi:crotonobetainyl-CoA:carnitine CoA-transferase CaiB-like acyl-CoA transferase
MVGLGFYAEVEKAGFSHLGQAMDCAGRRTELLALLDRLFATNTRDHWVAKLRAADIVSAPINTMLEAAADPDVLANGYVTEVDYSKHGKRLRVHGSPWQFSETPAKIGIAPELGQHNGEVLASLGYSEADIEGLRERKII